MELEVKEALDWILGVDSIAFILNNLKFPTFLSLKSIFNQNFNLVRGISSSYFPLEENSNENFSILLENSIM